MGGDRSPILGLRLTTVFQDEKRFDDTSSVAAHSSAWELKFGVDTTTIFQVSGTRLLNDTADSNNQP